MIDNHQWRKEAKELNYRRKWIKGYTRVACNGSYLVKVRPHWQYVKRRTKNKNAGKKS